MNIITITDLAAPELDIYARMTENQLVHIYEPDHGLFIAESPNVIERALGAGYEPVSVLVDTRQIEAQAAHVLGLITDANPEITVYTAEYEILTRLTGYALARGLLCAMRRRALPSPEEVCRNASRVAVLEDVMNPTNVGAIFRSAAALGMDAVLLTGGCADPLYRRSARVSMGTVFQIPWTYMEALTDSSSETSSSGMRRLQTMGFKTASMALRKNTIDINDPQLKKVERLAVILGTEGEGLRTTTIDASDYTIKIPMFHGVDSLNVAAASAVAFWELGQRV